MKRIVLSILIFVVAVAAFARDGYPLDLTISGPPFYNVLRISSFDVKNANNQPVFFTVRTRNITTEDLTDIWLHFSMTWNNQNLIDPNTRARYKNSQLLPGESITFTNRDVFTESNSFFFDGPIPRITVSEIIDNLTELRDVILNTGLFPDGSYTITTQFKNESGTIEHSPKRTLTFTVRNPGGIFLIRPGSVPGSAITTVTSTPVTFLWSSNLTGSQVGNRFTLLIKEFDDPDLLTPSFIETSGNTIVNFSNIQNTYYSEFINFKENRYYAWQISTDLFDPAAGSFSAPSEIKSPYYVFRYSTETEQIDPMEPTGDTNPSDNINTLLLDLNIPGLIMFLNDGYSPTGVIEYNGVIYTGTEAENLLQNLLTQPVNSFNITD